LKVELILHRALFPSTLPASLVEMRARNKHSPDTPRESEWADKRDRESTSESARLKMIVLNPRTQKQRKSRAWRTTKRRKKSCNVWSDLETRGHI